MGSHIIIAPGSINVDLILRTDVRKGPKTFRGRYAESQGGKGSNQAVAAKRTSIDRDVYLVGAVGEDTWGDQAVAALTDSAVDTRFVRRDNALRTGVVMEYLYGDGELTIGLEPGANDSVSVQDIEQARAHIESATLLLGQMETPLQTVEHAFRLARTAGVSTCLDPCVVPTTDTDRQCLFDNILPNVDLIAPNRSEAEELTGVAVTDDDTALGAANMLLEHVAIVVLTRGSAGALVARRDEGSSVETCFVRGLDVAAIDGGAAGDTFRGALATAIAEAQEMGNAPLDRLPFETVVEAAHFANAAAAICVTRPGACPSIPTRRDVAHLRSAVGGATGG